VYTNRERKKEKRKESLKKGNNKSLFSRQLEKKELLAAEKENKLRILVDCSSKPQTEKKKIKPPSPQKKSGEVRRRKKNKQ